MITSLLEVRNNFTGKRVTVKSNDRRSDFIYLFIYLLLKSYSKYMIDREDRQMKIKTQTYHKKQTK